MLKNHLSELMANFPYLKLITGDAIYTNRPLTEVLLDENCDYLLQIKKNQGDLQEAVVQCLGAAHEHGACCSHGRKKGNVVECCQLWIDLDNAEMCASN